MTLESRPCQFTELPFPISVTAGESSGLLMGGTRRAEGWGGQGGGGGSASLLGIFGDVCPLLCDEGYFWESVFP